MAGRQETKKEGGAPKAKSDAQKKPAARDPHKARRAKLKRVLAKKPRKNYSRQNVERFARLKDTWRTPRGIDSDQRKKQKNDGPHPSKTHRTPREIRGMHPSGYFEVLVGNQSQLKAVDAEHAVRIISGVGGKKREAIVKEAQKLNLKVLNA